MKDTIIRKKISFLQWILQKVNNNLFLLFLAINVIAKIILKIVKLKIGQTYKVNITHVNTPSNFFVQLVPTINNTANMLNNLDNHYRNEIDDPELKNG